MTRTFRTLSLVAILASLVGCEDNSGPQYTNAEGEAATGVEIAASKSQAERDARDRTAIGMREKAMENERKKLLIQKSAGAVLTPEQEAIVAAGPARIETENERRARQRAYDERQKTTARGVVTERPVTE
jgi:predicted small lipoprotein YifL